MLRLTYSGRSKPSALLISSENEDIEAVRSSRGEINWGRAVADTDLNPDISNVTNKRRMRELFAEHGVPMPKLLTRGHSILNFGARGHEWDYPILGRPDHHMKGRGFWLCRTPQEARRAIRGTRRKKAATHFMEYIDAPREYRVHIFLGKSIRISEKDHTAFHEYTTIKPTHNVKHVRKAAKQAVEAVGLDFGAVDILADDDRAWVLEVNAAPGLGGSMPRLYADTFTKWYEGEW